MSEPTILFVKPAAISAPDKDALKSAGIIVIEIDDPASAKFVRAGPELTGGELLRAACEAIYNTPAGNYARSVREAFAEAIAAAVIDGAPQ